MSKKRALTLNIVIAVICLVVSVIYLDFGRTWLKAINSSLFVLMGFVNLTYAKKSKIKNRKLYTAMATALLLCMVGDVVINLSFVPGAFIFGLGHVCFLFAYCRIERFHWKDLIPSAGIFVLAVLIIKLSPNLVFDPAILEWVCLAYALIISLMVGKVFSVFAKERNRFTVLLFVGVLLFVISDVALIFNMFADGGRITRILCLFTYYPANCILAHSMFQSVELQVAAKRKKSERRCKLQKG